MGKIKKKYTDYQSIFDDVIAGSKNDSTVLKQDTSEHDELNDDEYYLKARNKFYTNLTKSYETNYIETHKQKRKLKLWFFIVVMSLYSIIILGSMFAILYSLISQKGNIEIIIGSVISLISTIATIPIIIARYLFPLGEDKQMGKMVNKMQKYDKRIRMLNDKNDLGK